MPWRILNRKQNLRELKRALVKSTIIVAASNTHTQHLTELLDRKIGKKREVHTSSTDVIWLVNVEHKPYNSRTHTFQTPGEITKIEGILCHKAKVHKFKRISHTGLLHHNWIKLDISNRKINKTPETWKTNLLNSPWVNEIRKKSRKIHKTEWPDDQNMHQCIIHKEIMIYSYNKTL